MTVCMGPDQITRLLGPCQIKSMGNKRRIMREARSLSYTGIMENRMETTIV